jgi:hypothetical protein
MLVEKRIAFTLCLGSLFLKCRELGLTPVLCEALRTPMQADWNATHCSVKVNGDRCERAQSDPIHGSGGHQFHRIGIGIGGSLHQLGLAIDILLMRQKQDGSWAIDEAEANYRTLGEHWKGLHPLARAGVDFGDSGHFSLEHDGRK